MSVFTMIVSMLVAALVALVPGLTTLLGGGRPAAGSQTVQRTLEWANGSARVLEVSNVRGSVRVVAEDRRDVTVVAVRTIERESASSPAPDLDFRMDGDRMLVCGDASRCGCHLTWTRAGMRTDEEGGRARVDFELHVPRRATLDLCAVTAGALEVVGAQGPYTLRHVNGDIQMTRMGGAGTATTVNGNLAASYATVPAGASAFKTVNGRVTVTLPASLSADLRLKTVNGGLYTDFDVTPLPSLPTVERRNGGRVYRADRFASVRVGSGGPQLQFETMNGDVQVRRQP